MTIRHSHVPTTMSRRALGATLIGAAAAATGLAAVTGAPRAHAADVAAPDTSGADAPGTGAALDLRPSFTVSDMKAEGYAGLVALHLENVGTERYYGEFPLVTFRLDVTTVSVPEGVDRVITPGWFHGAHARDLGFDAESSTRSFLVTLANPVERGERQLVANLNFADGLTREGRLVQHVTVTQVGRLEGDTSTGNDQGIDSRSATRTDLGAAHSGLF
ncbi:hypothetical protein JSY14_09805 [Brachybacterium sp. EF45031]|uniref:hypothetical protein n=1 Tax=Brachybacterium sillae TaxID=2810536 RepID=UPI00217E25B4|nr:hypothetical protein [Brachybacterium sillae]MCS6712297.1 hypothetical protein [Brachybacterium sillae]